MDGITVNLTTPPVKTVRDIPPGHFYKDYDGDVCLRTAAGFVVLTEGWAFYELGHRGGLRVSRDFGPLEVTLNGEPLPVVDEEPPF